MHGTNGGYRKHYRSGERPCLACRIAYDEYRNDRRKAPQRRAILDAEVAIYEKRRRRAA